MRMHFDIPAAILLSFAAVVRGQGVDAPRPVSGFFAAEYDPVASPDGRYIAYTSTAAGNEDIWVTDTKNGRRWQVTESSSSDYSPCFMGNGKVVFVSTRDDAGGDIFIADISGKNPVKVIGGAGYHDSPKVSPDGKSIAYVHADDNGETRVYLFNLKTNETLPGPVGFDPAFSPSGETMLFIAPRGDSSGPVRIGIYDLRQSTSTYISLDSAVYAGPAFLSDGGNVVVARYGSDSNHDGFISRIDTPELEVIPLEGNAGPRLLYPGFHFREPYVSLNDRIYVTSEDLDIFSISASGAMSKYKSAESQAIECDSLIGSSISRSDSLLAAAACMASYHYYPDSCREYILRAADIYSSLGQAELAGEFFNIAVTNNDRDFAAGAALEAIRAEFQGSPPESLDNNYNRAYAGIREIIQRNDISMEIVKEAYLCGILFSREAGRLEDSNSLIVEGLLMYTGDQDFTALLEMWRLRNIATSFKGDVADITPLFIDYMDRFKDRPALTDSVIYCLIDLTRSLDSEIALAALENFRSGYPDRTELAAASSLEQARRFEDSNRIDMARWKYQEALQGCPGCSKIRFDAFAALGDINLLRDDLGSAGESYDSAGNYLGAVPSSSEKHGFLEKYALLNDARGYEVLSSNPSAAASFFYKSIAIDKRDAYAIWGMARALPGITDEDRWKAAADFFSDESDKAYFNALRYIIEYESGGDIALLREARRLLKRAIELDYKFPLPYLSLGFVDCALEAGSEKKAALYEEAVEISTAGLSIAGDNSTIRSGFRLNLGEAYFGLGQFKAAYQNYIEAVQLDSTLLSIDQSDYYYIKLGESGFQIDSLDAALGNYLKVYKKAVSAGNAAQQAFYAEKLGLISQASGNYLAGIEYYETALPFHQSLDDNLKIANILKAEASCYFQYGDFEAAAGTARKSLEAIENVKNGRRLLEDRLKITIRPLGIDIPLVKMGPMIYGGSKYPYGFTEAADKAYLSSISRKSRGNFEKAIDDRNKIAILSEGGEENNTTDIYNDLGIQLFESGYFDSAAVSFEKAFELSLKREEFVVALDNLANLATAILSSRGEMTEFTGWIERLEEKSLKLYGKLTPSDNLPKATIQNILGVCNFIKSVINAGNAGLKGDANFKQWLANLDKAARDLAASLEICRSRFGEGISLTAFTEEQALTASLSLNEAVVSYILGDMDGYRTAVARAGEASTLSQSEIVYGRARGCQVLLSGSATADSIENALASFEALIPGQLSRGEESLVKQLYDDAAALAWNSGDTLLSLEYVERSRNFVLVNYLELISPEIFGDDLVKAYTRQLRKYQKDLIDLRARERKLEALGITGQVALKKTEDEILSLSSNFLELKEKIKAKRPQLIPWLSYDRRPARLLFESIPAGEICIIPYLIDDAAIAWIVDSAGIKAFSIKGRGDSLTDGLREAFSGAKTVSICSNHGDRERLRKIIAAEFPDIRIKSCYSISEAYGDRRVEPRILEGMAVVRFEGFDIDDTLLTRMGAGLVSPDSIKVVEGGTNYGWIIFDGKLHYDSANPLMSYWNYGNAETDGADKSSLYVYELLDLPLSSFGAIVTDFPRADNFGGDWAVIRTILEEGFASLIVLGDSTEQQSNPLFVRKFVENYGKLNSIDAFMATGKSIYGDSVSLKMIEYYGEDGWDIDSRREQSRRWFEQFVASGDSASISKNWVAAARFYAAAEKQIVSADVSGEEADRFSRRLIETNLRIGDYEKALGGQLLLINEARNNIQERILRWQEYREIGREAGDVEQSIRASNELIPLAEKIGDSSLMAETYLHLAEDHLNRKDFIKAVEFSGTAAEKAAAVSDSVLLAEAYFIRGKARMETGDKAAAVDDLNRALNLFRKANSETGEYDVLASLGRLYTEIGDYPAGRDALVQAISYFGRKEDELFLEICRYYLALNYFGSGRILDAERLVGMILENNPSNYDAAILSSAIARRRGMTDISYKKAVEAVNLIGPLGEPAVLSRAYENLGDVFYIMDDHRYAAEQYRLAIEYIGRDSTEGYPGLLLYKLASSAAEAGENKNDSFSEIKERTGDGFIKDLCIFRQAADAIKSGDRKTARLFLDEIMSSTDEKSSRTLKWRGAFLIGSISRGDSAGAYLTMADSLYSVRPPEPSFVKDEFRLEISVGDVLAKSAELKLAAGEIGSAIDSYEKGLLSGISALHLSDGDFDSLEIEFLDALSGQKGPDSSSFYGEILGKFIENNPRYGRLWGVPSGQVDNLKKTLAPTQCVIRFFQLPDELLSFYIDSDTAAYNIVEKGKDELRGAALSLSEALRESGRADSILESWYTEFISPFEKLMVDKEDALLVPDGILIGIPLKALKKPDADYLGEMYNLYFAVSLPSSFPGENIQHLSPCIARDERNMPISVVNSIAEALGGCRQDSTDVILFTWGGNSEVSSLKGENLICDLKPVSIENYRGFQLEALRAARDGNIGIAQTLWDVPNQALSYFYWAFLRKIIAGEGLDFSHRAASSFVFGRYRGAPYYWAFNSPFRLN